MPRKVLLPNLVPFDANKYLNKSGEFYLWKDEYAEESQPSMVMIEGNPYYRFMNFLYSPQPPESLSVEKVVEICDLRLKHLNKLVNYSYNRQVVAAIADYLQTVFPTMDTIKALDFGCGSGLSLQLMQEHFPQLEIEGVDISEKAIQSSHGHGLPATLIYSGQPLPFVDGHFQLVVAIFVMHFRIGIQALAEIRRVLHPQGKYVFNLFQREIDGVEQQLIEAGFRAVKPVKQLSTKGEKHWIVSCE